MDSFLLSFGIDINDVSKSGHGTAEANRNTNIEQIVAHDIEPLERGRPRFYTYILNQESGYKGLEPVSASAAQEPPLALSITPAQGSSVSNRQLSQHVYKPAAEEQQGSGRMTSHSIENISASSSSTTVEPNTAIGIQHPTMVQVTNSRVHENLEIPVSMGNSLVTTDIYWWDQTLYPAQEPLEYLPDFERYT